jgi:hypothetical protein
MSGWSIRDYRSVVLAQGGFNCWSLRRDHHRGGGVLQLDIPGRCNADGRGQQSGAVDRRFAVTDDFVSALWCSAS